MNKESVYIFPAADGVLILRPSAVVSPELLDFCGTHTFREIMGSAYAANIDVFRTKLLYRQLSPAPVRYQPQRYRNEMKDDKVVCRAIYKYKHRYPDTVCVYGNRVLSDDDLPMLAKQLGVRLLVRPHFQRIGCYLDDTGRPMLKFYGRPPQNLLSCSFGPVARNFDITYNKTVWVVSRQDVPSYRRISQTLKSICADRDLSEEQKHLKIHQSMGELAPAERLLLSFIFFESPDKLDLRSGVMHELKHIVNDIRLAGRRLSPSCGKLNAEQMRMLFIHDELSASMQEMLTALEQIHKGREPDDVSEFSFLIPVSYMKFTHISKAEQARVLANPQPVLRELIPNWLQYHYDYYRSQFSDLFGHLNKTYPTCQWSNDVKNDSSEYQKQKRLLYTLSVTNPTTQRTHSIDCTDLVTDALFYDKQGLSKVMASVRRQYRQHTEVMAKYGITPRLINQARRQHFMYQQKLQEQAAEPMLPRVKTLVRKNIFPPQKERSSR